MKKFFSGFLILLILTSALQINLSFAAARIVKDQDTTTHDKELSDAAVKLERVYNKAAKAKELADPDTTRNEIEQALADLRAVLDKFPPTERVEVKE